MKRRLSSFVNHWYTRLNIFFTAHQLRLQSVNDKSKALLRENNYQLFDRFIASYNQHAAEEPRPTMVILLLTIVTLYQIIYDIYHIHFIKYIVCCSLNI